jgi:hypothetical protein
MGLFAFLGAIRRAVSCFSRQIAEGFAPAATRIAARATLLAEAAGNGGTLGSVLPGIGTVGGTFGGFADATIGRKPTCPHYAQL